MVLVWMLSVVHGNMNLDIDAQRMTARPNVMRDLPRKILLGAKFLKETLAVLNWRGSCLQKLLP